MSTATQKVFLPAMQHMTYVLKKRGSIVEMASE